MKSPFFSLIVPVYNVEKYLKQCLNSVLSQSFKDYELIVVNDGSTDNGGAICDEYENMDSRVRVIHQKNGGLSAARNTGIKIAKGKYLWFVDSDDYIKEDSLGKLHKSLSKEEVDVLGFSNIVFFEEKGKVEINNLFPETEILSNSEFFKKELPLVIAPWIYVFNHDFLKKNEINFREDIIIHEDWFFLHEVFVKLKRIKCLQEHFYFYRIRPNSLTTSSNRDLDKLHTYAESIYQMNDLRNRHLFQKFWDDKIYQNVLDYYQLYFSLKDKFNLQKKQKNKKDYKKIRKIKLYIYKSEAFGVKLMKLAHNYCFPIYKYALL